MRGVSALALGSCRARPRARARGCGLLLCFVSGATGRGGTPSAAEVRWRDGGPPELDASASASSPLPTGELADAAHPPVMQDESGKRLAYVRASGDVRLVYLVGRRRVPRSDRRRRRSTFAPRRISIMRSARSSRTPATRRAQLVADVTKEKGEAGVVRMLIDGAGVDAREWDDAFAKLPEARAAEVKTASRRCSSAASRRRACGVPSRSCRCASRRARRRSPRASASSPIRCASRARRP